MQQRHCHKQSQHHNHFYYIQNNASKTCEPSLSGVGHLKRSQCAPMAMPAITLGVEHSERGQPTCGHGRTHIGDWALESKFTCLRGPASHNAIVLGTQKQAGEPLVPARPHPRGWALENKSIVNENQLAVGPVRPNKSVHPAPLIQHINTLDSLPMSVAWSPGSCKLLRQARVVRLNYGRSNEPIRCITFAHKLS